MIGKERIFEVFKKVIDRSPAERTELLYLGGRSDLTRYAKSQIHQNVSENNTRVYLRVAEGKRLGVVTVNSLEEGPLIEAAERALELARHQPENPYFEDFPKPAEYEQTNTYFEATAKFSPRQRAEAVKKIFAEADKLGFKVSGAFSTGEGEIAVLNSNGVEAYQPLTEAELKLVPVSGEGMSLRSAFAHDVTQIDFDRVAAEALERCSLNKNQQEIELGQYDVILEPGCLAEVMMWLSFIAFGSNAYIEGTSFLAGRLGERSMGENITIYDSVHEPEAQGLPFDLQGFPKKRVTLIERGINRGVVFDLVSAKQAGAEPTGHAGPPDSPWGAIPWNICLEPGDSSLEEMIASCERGLLISQFHYLNGYLDTKKALMTGMTRYGTFFIEDGKIKHAVKNLRWTESMLRAFSNVRAISRKREVTSYGGGSVFAIMPALYIKDFTFTGVQKEAMAG
ncbi:MAG: TldD/PmbA family protein [Candidatus Bipolaricaulia bacterium]